MNDENHIEKLGTWIDSAINTITENATEYIPKFLLGIFILIVGLKLIKILENKLKHFLKTKHIDATLQPFLVGVFAWGLRVLVFITVARMVGIETTSFVAVLGATGLAVGLAFQGALSNFAGGILLLIFKPYKVGDLIEVKGYFGRVSEIQILHTFITTLENKTVIIPNGEVSNTEITNYSKNEKIRVDMQMGVAYEADLKKARTALLEVLNNNDLILSDPKPFVGVMELGDSSVNLSVRCYCHPDNYWPVYFQAMEAGKLALDKEGVVIPFPQVDVHMKEK